MGEHVPSTPPEQETLPLPHGVREAEKRLAQDVYEGINTGVYEVQPASPSRMERLQDLAERGKNAFGRLIEKSLLQGSSMSWNPEQRRHNKNK